MYKYDINTVLYTKDGRRLGNALIVGYDVYAQYLSKPIYIIKTDYGNELKMTAEQIESSFYVGSVCSASHKHFRGTFVTKETLNALTSADSKQAEACKTKSREECSWEKLSCIKVYDIDQTGESFSLIRNYHMTPDLSLSAIKTIYRRMLVREADATRRSAGTADCYSTSFATDVKVLDVPDEEILKLVQYNLHSLALTPLGYKSNLTPYKDEHGEVRLKGRWTSYPVKRFADCRIVTPDASLRSTWPTCKIVQ